MRRRLRRAPELPLPGGRNDYFNSKPRTTRRAPLSGIAADGAGGSALPVPPDVRQGPDARSAMMGQGFRPKGR